MRRFAVITLVLFLLIPGQAAFSQGASKPEKINLAFAGDILLDGFVGDQIANYGVNFPFARVGPVLKKADIAFANLETPVSVRGKAAEKSFAFRSKPAALAGLSDAGIDGVTLANNHILDFGQDAMLDTLVHLDKYKIGHTGAGKNSNEAFKPYIQTVKGKKIAILGVSRVLSSPSWYAGKNSPGAASAYTPEPMLGAIKKSAKENDFTIVYIHWNNEFKDYPEPYARSLAKQMIDSGADIIIGAHSHCLMGIEYYKHKPIYYSLGNFVFNRSTRGGDKTIHSMLVNFEISNTSVKSRITPVKIIGGQPNFMGGAYNKDTIKRMNQLSFNAVIAADGAVSEKL
ncbi:CapA family protein [Paenibacillus jilunlii]|uniref:Capsule biosynthesis protein n=1 Tax=Paenibacillus jilunlii TaxID=682956 RepID=A0A1G9QC55_9BACL|nr:CapA family protein [Paenibacillus jilunlii]KWX73091.1 capsule biosynthesis protein [Paenibacillus jilunlii]SDM08559.1 poly-gamma-glutamate synthesis protein (capsule biosynthesis protein) [Paenibacillus jilunlii]